MADLRPLRGKVALVTGASSGVGRRFALVLAQHGATVVAAARRTDRLETLVAEIADGGGRARFFDFDAAKSDAADRLFDALRRNESAPSILVNAAGISRPGRAERHSPDDFDQTVAVNIRAPWRLSQRCAAHWIENSVKGVIVNVSSMLAKRVGTGVSIYSMSKAALSHLSAAQAREWARYGIRVNTICPGYLRTEINERFWSTDTGRRELERLPRQRIGEPEDLDSALLFLVDPRSCFVNGAEVVVDDAQSWAI